MLKKTGLFSLAILLVASVGPASADGHLTTAYVVHGIPGQDVMADPALPVDVEVSGLGCALQGFSFGDRVGPLEVPAGEYDITISLADEAEPCSGTAVIGLTGVPLEAGANSTIIAHRTANGDPGPGDLLGLGITASLFGNDFTSTLRGKGRIIAHHTALAPSVDVVVSRDYSDSNAPSVTVPDFTNPTADGDFLSQINAEFRPGEWDVALEYLGATAFGPDTINLRPFTGLYIYAVGDFFTGSFQYLVYTETGLKGRIAGPATAGERVNNRRRAFAK